MKSDESGPVICGMNPPAAAIASLYASGPVIGGVNPPAAAIASLYASGPVIGGMNPPAAAIASLNASGPVIGGMNPPAGAIASLNESGPVIGGMNPPAGAIASLNAFSLAALLAPLTLEGFQRDYAERLPLYLDRAAPAWLELLPGMRALDAVVGRAAGSGRVRLVRQGSAFPGPADALPAILSAYAQGSTIVVAKVQEESPSLGALAAALQEGLEQPVGINLYLTPPGAQGFKEHADGHDVFILQLSGKKRWSVFQPVIELPLESQVVRPPPLHEQILPPPPEGYGAPILEATLARGQLLYLPRGFVHAAATSEQGSAHLTIGVHALRHRDLLSEMVAVAAERARLLRETLPPLGRDRAREVSAARALLQAALDALADPGALTEALARAERRQARAATACVGGSLEAIERCAALELNTMLAHRRGTMAVAFLEAGKACLEFGGNRVDGPEALLPTFELVAQRRRFTPADLPDELSSAAKLTLARRLIVEGLIIQS